MSEPMTYPVPFHPLADLFPMMDWDDLRDLAGDIKTNGLRQPIVTLDGMILDGRNRYRACLECGVLPRFVDFDGDDPVAFVISLNLRRRHLNESQRALVGAKLSSMHVDNAKSGNIHMNATHASALLNVGRTTIDQAARVIASGSEALVRAVEKGDVAVSAAAEVAVLPQPVQRDIVLTGPRAVVEEAKRLREARQNHRAMGTGENEWYTPPTYIDLAREVLDGFDLDPASSPIAQETVRAAQYFTVDDNGLTKPWDGTVWLNPPYSQPDITHFVEKLVHEVSAGRCSAAILLTHNYTDTAWFHHAATACQAICFTRGRIRFVSPTGQLASPTQGQAFFYFGGDVNRFREKFSAIGFVR